jgi:hypothetical protein
MKDRRHGSHVPDRFEKFSLAHGASWLTPDGDVYPVPGFHEEWLREHEDISNGARNVCEFILRTRWISVALFEGGYLELMVPDRRSADVKKLIYEFLSRNASVWAKALVMSMDEEGYAMLTPSDVTDVGAFEAALAKSV